VRQIARRDEPPPSLFESFLRRLREIAWGGESENADLRGTLEELIEEAEQEAGAGFSQEERTIVRNALSFGELTVGDVMVPRADVRGVEVGAGLGDVVKAIRDAGHSRLLVYRGTLDEMLGVVHVKDLLAYWGDGETFSLEQATRPVLVVPPSMRVIELLLEMRASGQRVAIVVDEFGGTDGLATLEDLVAEIVGELHEAERAAAPAAARSSGDS
jgi:CBS domain containing-hemolysin-like protein